MGNHFSIKYSAEEASPLNKQAHSCFHCGYEQYYRVNGDTPYTSTKCTNHDVPTDAYSPAMREHINNCPYHIRRLFARL